MLNLRVSKVLEYVMATLKVTRPVANYCRETVTLTVSLL